MPRFSVSVKDIMFDLFCLFVESMLQNRRSIQNIKVLDSKTCTTRMACKIETLWKIVICIFSIVCKGCVIFNKSCSQSFEI